MPSTSPDPPDLSLPGDVVLYGEDEGPPSLYPVWSTGFENPDQETIIYSRNLLNIEELNADRSLRPPPTLQEMSLLDVALTCTGMEPDLSLDLSVKFLMLTTSKDTELECSTRARNRNSRKKKKPTISKRTAKKREYAELQRLYRKNRSSCFSRIFKPHSFAEELQPQTMYCKHLLKNSIRDSNIPDHAVPDNYPTDDPSMMNEVLPEEVRNTRLPYSSSAGPDGITVASWEKVPVRARCKLFTIWLQIGKVPDFIIQSRTIFIPKKKEATSPADSRPISISSVILSSYIRS